MAGLNRMEGVQDFAQQLNVYGRGGEECVTCKKILKEIRQGQRATVYCAFCQK